MAKLKRYVRKNIKRKLQIVGCFFALILVAVALLFFKPPVPINKVSAMPNEVMGISVSNELITIHAKNRPGTKRQIKYIVIHETGNFDKDATAKSHSIYLRENDPDYNSWHYTVDEKEIIHHIPDNEIAYHAGDTSKKSGGNENGVGIELCVNAGSDFEATFDHAARLSAYLIDFYDLKIDALKQHRDFIDKECPKTILKDNRSEEFKNLALSYLKVIQGKK